jgi:hypothetical protein
MKTLELEAPITEDRVVTLYLPAAVEPGDELHVRLTAPEQAQQRPVLDLPCDDVGPWPEGLSLRREDLYGDDGR